MGSGKTTIGNCLKQNLNYKFYDLDNFIEEKWDLNISKIFETKGELYFRKVERKALEEILDQKAPMIISLGGGTPCYSNNIDYINTSPEQKITKKNRFKYIRCLYSNYQRTYFRKMNIKEKTTRMLLLR